MYTKYSSESTHGLARCVHQYNQRCASLQRQVRKITALCKALRSTY